jgi:hypothetical protein
VAQRPQGSLVAVDSGLTIDPHIGCPTPHGVRRCAIHVFPLLHAAETWGGRAKPAMTMRADRASGRSFIVAVGMMHLIRVELERLLQHLTDAA